MEVSKVYVLRDQNNRPAKRRRVEQDGNSMARQLASYRETWAIQEKRLNVGDLYPEYLTAVANLVFKSVVHNFYKMTVDNVMAYIQREGLHQCSSRLPVGLIVTSVETSSQGYIFKGIGDQVCAEPGNIFVSLTASDAPNLKTLLRTLIKRASNLNESVDEEDLLPAQGRGMKLLSYDLQILHDFAENRNIKRIVLSFSDIETFDVAVLSEALHILLSWLDRLPLICLFGVATSVENLHERLPQAAIKCCAGEAFDIASLREVTEMAFRTFNDDQATLRLGPRLTDLLMQRQKEQGQNVQRFIQSLKYCFMSHFFGNSLSILLVDSHLRIPEQEAILESIRHLPSFRRHIQSLINSGSQRSARKLLNSNEALREEVVAHLSAGQAKVAWMLGTIRLFEALVACVDIQYNFSFSTLYCKALSGELRQSTELRELLLFVRRASSDKLAKMLPLVIEILITMPANDFGVSPDDFSDLLHQLEELLKMNDISHGPLRSQHDLKNETYRTTVVAQKVELSTQKSRLSKSDSAYSALITAFHDHLSYVFTETLSGIDSLFLNEVLFYDSKSPYRDTLAPRARPAIERALSRPHDYLGCACCESGKGSLSPNQPPTAIIYQLYLESGALINVFDLWSAFRAIVGDLHENEQTTMAVFVRGLAELKRIGYIKPSRRKADHFAKAAWIGL